MVWPALAGAIGAGASKLGSIFGQRKQKALPSAFQSMPAEFQNSFRGYNNSMQNYFNGQPHDVSQFVAGLNPYQQSYLQNAGQYGVGNLEPFMSPYQQAVTDQVLGGIQRQGDINKSGIQDAIGQNSRFSGVSNAAAGGYLAQNDEATNRAMADARANLNQANYMQALQSRQQNLGNMFNAGGLLQGQQQAELDVNNPYLELMRQQQSLQGINPSMFQSPGMQPGGQNRFGQVSGAVGGLFGNQNFTNALQGLFK